MLLLLAPVSNFCSGPASLIVIPYNETETKNILFYFCVMEERRYMALTVAIKYKGGSVCFIVDTSWS